MIMNESMNKDKLHNKSSLDGAITIITGDSLCVEKKLF